ncbi:DUF3533 domain-containing protein [Nakamurella endophytica]|nr:DUF3533 domain-containing protein [Nakamurella endophytica]
MTLGAELRDAIGLRTVALVVGVLLLQLGFILSYVGAFHAPTPHRVPVAVVAPAQAAPQLVGQLNGLAGDPLDASAAPDEATARARLARGDTSAVLLYDAGGTRDTLLVASGGGASVVTAVQTVVERVDAAQQRTVQVQDVVPLQPGDARGLTGFYLVIGWIVGGYLLAALLGVARGSRPANLRRAWFRLGAVVPYAIASGIGGALVVDTALHALTGHFWALAWVGALVVAAAATVTMAFQILFGVIGIGVTVLVFVVLGNPSAGGAYQSSVLPPFWRALSPVLPNGAGTTTVRQLTYFGGASVTGPLLVLAAWAVAGVLLTVVAAVLRERRGGARTAVL